ncbi:MAG TPA: serine hydrolase domain-containing protein [Acidimicrobiales bacterium]|nr:serine hydrolase domain-containing protein [Acidimicrobiales bacterium]
MAATLIDALVDAVRAAIEAVSFSGAVRIDVEGAPVLRAAHGLADRAHGVANTPDTRFAIASGTKTHTALAVVSLIADGTLALDTTARALLGDDLPLVDDTVTVEHLLAHRSGIGDYLDEEDDGEITDHVLTVPVHELDCPEAYLRVLDGHPTKHAPDTRFSYCNGGFVLLALLAERAAGVPYADLVRTRVCDPAGLTSTGFLRSDELPGDAAIGYLGPDFGDRTNVLHLPVVGVGDGGLTSTLDDVHRLWRAFRSGAVVPPGWVDEMVRPRSDPPEHRAQYGLGLWLAQEGAAAQLEGYDAGVSFRSADDPVSGVTWTVVSNTSEGAWPIARVIADRLAA